MNVAVAGEAAKPEAAPVGRFVGAGYVVAFVAVTGAGVAQALTTPGVLVMPGGRYALAVGAMLYAVIGTVVMRAA